MTRVLRAVGALVALAALVVGVPWMLIRLAGWPLPTKVPDLSNAATMVQQGNIEASTVIKVLAVLVWAAWLITVWSILWELVVNVPQLLKGRSHRPAPLAPKAMSKGVGWLFAVLLTTTSMSQAAHASSPLGALVGGELADLATTELSVNTSDASTVFTPALGDDTAATVSAGEVWVATDDDTLWSIAADTGVSVETLLASNAVLTASTFIHEGMEISLPGGVEVPQDRRSVDGSETVGATPQASLPTDVVSYTVQDNDGMWNVAQALLGDGALHVEMTQLALGQQVAPGVVFDADTLVIHPGWVFTAQPAAAGTVEVSQVAQAAEAGDVHVVAENESLSSIAQERWGDADRWVELWDLNGGRIMDDGRVFEDPNLIVTGWTINLADTPPPPPPVVVAAPDVVGDVGDVIVEASNAAVVESDTQSAEVALPPPTTQVQESPESAPATVGEVAGTAPVRSTFPAPTAAGAADVAGGSFEVDNGVEVVNEWDRSVWATVAGGSLLFAGLAMAVRRFRLRRLARLEPGERIAEPPSVAAGTELAIVRAPGSQEGLATLRGLMQGLTPYAAEQADPPAVRAVQIGTERIEVLFASPAPLPPKGWSTIDGSHSWTHNFDDEAVTSRQLLTPALVTIGVRDAGEDGQEVLLDLETAASVSISGDTDAALGMARSMALELATYPLGVPMDLCLIGLHVDGTEVCDRVWQDTTLQRAVRKTREYIEAMVAAGAVSMVSARSELEEDDGRHDPMIFIVNAASVVEADRALLDELVDICAPSMGVAVVVVGEHANANEQIRVDAASKALWSHVTLSAPSVSLQAAAEAAVLLDHAANADSEPYEPSEMMTEMLAETEAHQVAIAASYDDAMTGEEDGGSGGGDGDDVVPEFEYRAPSFDVLLKVMGNARTEGADLNANETELLGVLACLRGHKAVDLGLVHEAIAPTRERKTVENRISALRRKLGVGSNGEDLLPAIGTGGRIQHLFYELSRLVVTDVDLLEHRLHTAHELGSNDARRVLTDGLVLMQGPLFRAQKGFDGWPQSEGVVVAMTTIVTNYALMLIDLAVEVDDFALVARTTAAAGQVLDNPVSEFTIRQKEEEYAEACGDEDLAASVSAARQKLLTYLRDEDSLATP